MAATLTKPGLDLGIVTLDGDAMLKNLRESRQFIVCLPASAAITGRMRTTDAREG